MPKVSIIIPVYNVKKYLRQCLDSVVNQTLQDIEIICVDDGSTDGSEHIIDEYAAKDNRVLVIHKANAGYGHTMNRGLDVASGEYIGIVESDDFTDSIMFEMLYNKAKDLDVNIVKSDYFDYYSFGESYHKVYQKINDEKEMLNINDDFSIVNTSASIWSAIYRREFLIDKNIRFSETPGASYQDTAFCVKCLLAADKIAYLRKAFLRYRRDNINSSVHSKNKIYCICDEYEEINNYIKKYMNNDFKLLSIIQESKFSRYMWNLHRLGIEHKRKFLERMISEFQEANAEGLLDEIYWSDDLWHELDMMLSEKQKYINEYLNTVQNNHFMSKTFFALLENASNVYIYGAGAYCRNLMLFIPELYSRIEAFIVTEKNSIEEKYLNKKIMTLNECNFDDNKDLILVAVGAKLQYDIRDNLEKSGITNYVVVSTALRNAILNR